MDYQGHLDRGRDLSMMGIPWFPYLQEVHDERYWNLQSIATTDIAHPQTYLKKEVPTVLVSFAQSGNSPESVATVQLAQDLVDELYQITITFAVERETGPTHGDERNLLLLQPKGKPTMLALR